MAWTLVETFATIIEYMIYAYFMTNFLKPKNNLNRLICFSIILISNCGLTFGFNYLMPFEGLLGVIRIVLNLALSCILLNGSFFEKVFVSFVTDASVIVINYTTLNILGGVFRKTVEELIVERGMLRLTTLFITKFLFFLITKIIIKING